MSQQESAVIVAVPEAEDAVAAWRARLDPAAERGVPAHITVLYPFLPPDQLDAEAVQLLAEGIGEVPAFDCALPRVRWFGSKVVWLDPDPAAPFRQLTAGVWRRFPQCNPYGGAHTELVPHLTIGDNASPSELADAERSVQALLPIHARVTHARLISRSTELGSWRTVHELPLGPPGD